MSIRSLLLVLAATGLATPAAMAQRPGGRNVPPPRAEALRQELEERFLERMRTELDLTAEQQAKVQGILRNFGAQRRTFERDEREFRRALSQQLRPGIAANQDSVAKLVDGLTANRVAYAQVIQGEMRELAAVLTPIQRGQLFLMREQLFQRAQELRERAGGPGGPGPMPRGGRPGGPPSGEW